MPTKARSRIAAANAPMYFPFRLPELLVFHIVIWHDKTQHEYPIAARKSKYMREFPRENKSPGRIPRPGRSETISCFNLGDRNLVAQINILNRVQQLDAFLHGALEGF